MHETKCSLIAKHGTVCMLCKEQKDLRTIEWHHIKPRYASKREGFKPDDSVENGSLLCSNCHKLVHLYDYGDIRYKAYTAIILYNKNNKPAE